MREADDEWPTVPLEGDQMTPSCRVKIKARNSCSEGRGGGGGGEVVLCSSRLLDMIIAMSVDKLWVHYQIVDRVARSCRVKAKSEIC